MTKKYLPKSAEAPAADPSRRVLTSPPLEIHLSRSADRFECIQIKEPELLFGRNHRCVDPRTGLAAYGPYSNAVEGSRNQLRVGIIGTGEAIEKTLSLLHEISRPIEQDPNVDNILYPSFPGLNSGAPFSIDVISQPSWHKSVSREALRLAEECGDPTTKFGLLRDLYGTQVDAMSGLEFAPNVVICPTSAPMDRSLLIAACGKSIPIEIVSDGKWPESNGGRKNKAAEAWNLSVRLLYKAGFASWRLADARGDTCFVGIAFYPDAEHASTSIWTSCAHNVTDLGEGFVLRGDTFERDSLKGAHEIPHLERDQAAKLMSRILETYAEKVGSLPRKVVVHKTSHFTEAERLGFEDSLGGINQHSLVSVSKTGAFFLRPGRKPVFRGAAIPLGEKLGLVYLSGYIPFLRCHPGNRIPQPFEITENWGSLAFGEAAKDLLRLTKLNWTTSDFCTEVPITLADFGHARDIFRILGKQDIVLDDRGYL